MKDNGPIAKSGQVNKFDPFAGPSVQKAVPTSASQREIWGSLQMDAKATLCYNESIRVKLSGNLNAQLLAIAFAEVVQRHDCLRSIFSRDGLSMLVTKNIGCNLKIKNIQSDNNSKKIIDELIVAETMTEFDLIAGPAFRATLVIQSSNDALLFLTGHHIICDGWSMAVIVNELSLIYSSLSEGQKSNLAWPTQFCDFVNDPAYLEKSSDREYWKNIYKDSIPNLKLPIDYPRPNFRSFESKRIDKIVPPELAMAIKKWGAKNGCSYYVSLMGIFEILLHQITKSTDLVVGISSADQSQSGKYDLVGHLVNLLPIRQTVNSSDNKVEFFKKLKVNMLNGMDHQSFTFGSLLNELVVERDPSRIPLVNVIFNVDQQYPGQGLEFKEIEASYESNPRYYENFEIFINATSCGDKLVLECQYNTKLFKESTINNWLEHYISIISKVLNGKLSTIGELISDKLFIPKLEEKKLQDKKKIRVLNSDLEDQIAKIWETVLGMESIAFDQNFFSLGGHSLLGTEVISKINNIFGVSMTLKDIFEAPTVYELALKVDEGCLGEKLKDIKHLGLLDQDVDLSTAQFRAWYMEELSPRTTMHNLPSSIRIKGSVQHHLLEKTLNELIKRHESLRTYFVSKEGRPIQKVYETLEYKLEEISCFEIDLVNELNREAEHCFDLKTAPLIRAKLYKVGKDDYIFFFMVHHIIWDGWCFDIFFEELDSIYTNLASNRPIDLKELPEITYRDYSRWQNESLKDGSHFKQINFWKDQLGGELPILELPIDYNRPAVMSNFGGTIPFQLEINELRELREYAKKQGTSLYNVCLSAFKIALNRVTQESDIIVGTPVRGRSQEELNQIIGYFVNTVALRTEIDRESTLNHIVSSVMNTTTDAFGNQDVPFEKVLENIKYNRDSGRTPIYQVFFSYQDVSNRSAMFNGSKYTQVNIDKASTHTDLDLWIKSSSEKLEGAFEYRKDLFENISISRFKEIFLKILNLLPKSGNHKLSSVDILPESHRDFLVDGLNNNWNKNKKEDSLLELFYAQVDSRGSEIALISSTESRAYTYKEIDCISNQWAKELNRSGVCPGDLVGLASQRNNEMLISLLAIMKTGAGFVPLDPGFPQDRLDYMVNSSGIKVLLTTSTLNSGFTQELKRLLIEDLMICGICEERPKYKIKLNDTAYVIYTSGSTGVPKGVELPHGSVVNFLSSMSKIPGMKKEDKLLAVTTLSFDIAVLELYLPLICGASLYIANKEEAMDGHSLKEILKNNDISVMQATPSTWRLLLASGWKGAKDFKVLCGGEPFPKDLVNTLVPINNEVWNMYGPTETTVWSTCKKLSANQNIVSIGRPIENTSIYILDDNLNLLPIGSSGNMFIGGIGLAKGYYGQKDLTDEKFIENPFRKNERMYDTGDLARIHSNGELECLGRNDGQVKVRGYRIELPEIEVVISKLKNIEECVVITREDRPGDIRIVAYIRTNDLEELNPLAIRQEIGNKLPSYMIPSHFVKMKEFPKTLNNKIDKKNLPSPIPTKEIENSKVTIEGRHLPNQNMVQSEVENIWKNILGLDSIDPNANFFDIGGHSLIAVEMFSLIYKKYQLNLSLAVFFEAGTLNLFSQYIETQLGANQNNQHTTSINNVSQDVIKPLVSNMVAIKPIGNLTPIFCFHGAGGNVMNYAKLASLVESDRPIYGFQSPGVDGVSEFANSITELVELYTNELINFRPNGPYILAGGSMGGVLALEVGKKLLNIGHKVERLIMFDTLGPGITLDEFSSQNKNVLNDLIDRVSYQWERFSNRFKLNLLTYTGGNISHKLRYYFVEDNNYKLIRNHKINSFDGDITLIRVSSKEGGIYSDPTLGWKNTISGSIETIEIEGDHAYFLESEEFSRAFASLFKKP
jgi:amino acid adenylation domain-containing protein